MGIFGNNQIREFLVQTMSEENGELRNYKLRFTNKEVEISVDKLRDYQGFGRIGVVDGFQEDANKLLLKPTISNLRLGRKIYGRTSEFDFTDKIFSIYERVDEPK